MNTSFLAGQKVPSFQALTYDGAAFDSSWMAGKKAWIIFYRYAHCPLCNAHLHSLLEMAEDFLRKGICVVAVFESKPKTFPKTLGDSRGWVIPLLADPDRNLYELFGVARGGIFALLHPMALWGLLKALARGFRQGPITGALTQVPVHFMIKSDGTLFRVHRGKHVNDHPDWGSLKPFVEL